MRPLGAWGAATWRGPSAQLQVSVTRYQFLPLPGDGNAKFTLPDQPLYAM